MQARVEELLVRFSGRHRDLVGTFSHHADRIANRIPPDVELSEERWLLLGATFTHEYAVEAASICNPSIVAHPDQTSVPPGELRVVLSVRGIGEGHLSTIGFRTGTVSSTGHLEVDTPEPFPTLGTIGPAVFDREAFRGHLRAMGRDGESTAFVLDHLEARSPPSSSTNGSTTSPTRATPVATPVPRRRCSGDRGAQLPRALPRGHPPLRAGAVARYRGRVPRHGGRSLRAVRR